MSNDTAMSVSGGGGAAAAAAVEPPAMKRQKSAVDEVHESSFVHELTKMEAEGGPLTPVSTLPSFPHPTPSISRPRLYPRFFTISRVSVCAIRGKVDPTPTHPPTHLANTPCVCVCVWCIP